MVSSKRQSLCSFRIISPPLNFYQILGRSKSCLHSQASSLGRCSSKSLEWLRSSHSVGKQRQHPGIGALHTQPISQPCSIVLLHVLISVERDHHAQCLTTRLARWCGCLYDYDDNIAPNALLAKTWFLP